MDECFIQIKNMQSVPGLLASIVGRWKIISCDFNFKSKRRVYFAPLKNIQIKAANDCMLKPSFLVGVATFSFLYQ